MNGHKKRERERESNDSEIGKMLKQLSNDAVICSDKINLRLECQLFEMCSNNSEKM